MDLNKAWTLLKMNPAFSELSKKHNLTLLYYLARTWSNQHFGNFRKLLSTSTAWNFGGKFRSGRCDGFRQKIVEIGAILAISGFVWNLHISHNTIYWPIQPIVPGFARIWLRFDRILGRSAEFTTKWHVDWSPCAMMIRWYNGTMVWLYE